MCKKVRCDASLTNTEACFRGPRANFHVVVPDQMNVGVVYLPVGTRPTRQHPVVIARDVRGTRFAGLVVSVQYALTRRYTRAARVSLACVGCDGGTEFVYL